MGSSGEGRSSFLRHINLGVHFASNTLNDPPAKHAFEFEFLFLFCGVLFLSSGWPPTSYTVKNVGILAHR